MIDLLFRFLAGGVLVSLFAVIGDMVRPKSFAGLFGAAPSVALATLGLTLMNEGSAYAAIEARSMMIGAVAFMLYAAVCNAAIARGRTHVAAVAIGCLALWVAVALAGWGMVLRGAA